MEKPLLRDLSAPKELSQVHAEINSVSQSVEVQGATSIDTLETNFSNNKVVKSKPSLSQEPQMELQKIELSHMDSTAMMDATAEPYEQLTSPKPSSPQLLETRGRKESVLFCADLESVSSVDLDDLMERENLLPKGQQAVAQKQPSVKDFIDSAEDALLFCTENIPSKDVGIPVLTDLVREIALVINYNTICSTQCLLIDILFFL